MWSPRSTGGRVARPAARRGGCVKWQQARWLADDVAGLSGLPAPVRDVDDLVTVVMVTSAIPSHPSTG